jgi:dimethylamine monooxygenase subunit A
MRSGDRAHATVPGPSAQALPFLKGPPNFGVGLAPIDPENWLLPDDQAAWIGPKNALIDESPLDVFAQMPGSLEGQLEAAQMIGEAIGCRINREEPPLLAASRMVSDDLVLMQMPEDQWTARALCLCAPTFFSAQEAIGRSLSGLHGPVPGGDPQLAGRISRVFSMLAEGLVLERHNWTVQWSDQRHTPSGEPLRAAARLASPEEALQQLHLRVERQTIIRLPHTHSILFTIRIRMSHLASLLQDQAHARAFHEAWHGAPQQVRVYKKWEPIERHVHHLLSIVLPQ